MNDEEEKAFAGRGADYDVAQAPLTKITNMSTFAGLSENISLEEIMKE